MAVNAEALGVASQEERIYIASQWKLVWWRFKRHRVAILATAVIILFYFVGAFAEFFAIHEPTDDYAQRAFLPPQRVRFDGVRPFVYGITSGRDPETLRRVHQVDESAKHYLRFFVQGYDYKLLGLFSTNRHLIGADTNDTSAPIPVYLLGSDRMGRDMWSRLMIATRISMSVGLVGVGLSLFLGILLGGLSGYRGGLIDVIIQRVIEQIRSMPTIPLWLALAAAIPQDWSILRTYFAITVILSLIGWTTLAREVRGRFLSMREEDFVTAARVYGSGQLRVIFRHMLPSFYSHIIAATTLAVPAIIIAETSLSFLGLGLKPPAISWGVLMYEAQNIETVSLAPWLLLPGAFVVVSVLSFNFMGDGLRDAADPYSVQRN